MNHNDKEKDLPDSIVHIVVDDVTHYKETEISWDHWNLQAKLLKPLQRENGTMQLFLFFKRKTRDVCSIISKLFVWSVYKSSSIHM